MSESSTLALKKMDLSVYNSVGRVEPRFLAMAVTELTAEQVTAIIDNISDSCTLTLKKLNLSFNDCIGSLELRLLALAVARLEKVNVMDFSLEQ